MVVIELLCFDCNLRGIRLWSSGICVGALHRLKRPSLFTVARLANAAGCVLFEYSLQAGMGDRLELICYSHGFLFPKHCYCDSAFVESNCVMCGDASLIRASW